MEQEVQSARVSFEPLLFSSVFRPREVVVAVCVFTMEQAKFSLSNDQRQVAKHCEGHDAQ